MLQKTQEPHFAINRMRNSFVLLFFCLSFGQTAVGQGLQDSQIKEIRKAYHLFETNITSKTIPDSTGLLAFAFEIVATKGQGGTVKVSSLKANDSIGYRVFPEYSALKSIDYSVFMRTRKKATFIFPVIIEVYSSKQKGEIPFLSPLEHVLKLFYYPPGQNKLLDIKNYIYFKPYTIRLDKRVVD